ncbi:hypothetical protein U9M48_004184 [Paspalum notatum var. saurae]|uniref:Reverse transcriptase n=1 Tax=Paspalum notatum var. saurae TaxID=547442 RepID=A0AAQ3PUA5_PASNO
MQRVADVPSEFVENPSWEVPEQVFAEEGKTEDIPQVSVAENEMLTDTFTEKEVKQAIFQMEQNKAPGPDGFPAEFYQFFWETIKVDLMMLFVEFHKGCLPLYNLNFGIITLLPKEKDAKHIKHFCPICLLNLSCQGDTLWKEWLYSMKPYMKCIGKS